MSYINDNLLPNEKVHFRAKISVAVFLRAILSFIIGIVFFILAFRPTQQVSEGESIISGFQFVASILFFATAIFVGIRALVFFLTTEFGVTNRRIIAKRGFIQRRTMEILIRQVESVFVHQNILGRLLNFGTVVVIGTGGTKEPFRAISSPVMTRRIINEILEHYLKS